jgi:hypothetical protein
VIQHDLQVQDVSGLLDRLLNFLELGKDCVTAETLIQIKDLLRRYPHIADVAIASVANISPQVPARRRRDTTANNVCGRGRISYEPSQPCVISDVVVGSMWRSPRRVRLSSGCWASTAGIFRYSLHCWT